MAWHGYVRAKHAAPVRPTADCAGLCHARQQSTALEPSPGLASTLNSKPCSLMLTQAGWASTTPLRRLPMLQAPCWSAHGTPGTTAGALQKARKPLHRAPPEAGSPQWTPRVLDHQPKGYWSPQNNHMKSMHSVEQRHSARQLALPGADNKLEAPLRVLTLLTSSKTAGRPDHYCIDDVQAA